MERKCKCGEAVTKETGIFNTDGSAQCWECAETWHLVTLYGLDPYRARMSARRRLAAQ